MKVTVRQAKIERKTAETQIEAQLRLDGTGTYQVDTGSGFFTHMLELFARHGGFDLQLTCQGDTQVDYHHSVEDIGIVLGRAFSDALGKRVGIQRYGSFLLPMDEALVLVALDISGRGTFACELALPSDRVGDFDTELVKEFFLAFTRELGLTLHIRQLAGENTHHIIEAVFKGFARALAQAVAIDSADPNRIPSTKGTIL